MANVRRVVCKAKSLPEYKSTTVNQNDDGTYSVEHIFIDSDGNEVLFSYPRVFMKLKTSIEISQYNLNNISTVFPFDVDVLTDAKKVLNPNKLYQ